MRQSLTIEDVTAKMALVPVKEGSRTTVKRWRLELTFPADVHVRAAKNDLDRVVIYLAPDSMASAQLKREIQRGD